MVVSDLTPPAAFVPLAYQDLVGFVDNAARPISTMGNNANWVIANHCPPAVFVCPPEDRVADAMHVLPIAPSADGLDYEVWLGLYAGGAGANMTWRVAYNTHAVPQPQTSAHWQTIGSYADTLTASERDWVLAATVTVPASATHVRIEQVATTGTAAVTTVLVRPAALTAIPRAVRASGAVPWDDGMATDGGPVTPEHLNRIWRSIACTLADRVQAVAGWSQGDGLPLEFEPTTEQPWLPAARVPAWLEAQGGAKVTLRVGAKCNADGCQIVVGQTGGESHVFDVYNGLFYTYQTAQITLTHEAPTFYALVGGPDGAAVDLLYVTADWRPGD